MRAQGCADLRVRRGIDGAGRVVQNQHLGLLEQRAGDAQALLLPAGDVGAAALDARVVALRQAGDELVRASQAAGFAALRLSRALVAPAQVVKDGAGEEHVLLQHDGDLVAQRLDVVAAHVDAADLHAAAGHVIEPGNQADQARLGGARAAQNADRLAGGDVQIHIAQDVLAAAVGEVHMLKVDGAIRDRRHRGLGRGDIRPLVKHLLDALRRGHRLRDHDKDHREHHQAHQDVHDVGQQARQLAGRQARAPDDHLRAQPAQQQDAQVDAAHHDRLHEGDDALGADGVAIQVVRRAGEFLILMRLAHKRLDHANRADILLDRRVDRVILFEHLLEVAHGHWHQDGDDGDEQRHDRQEDQRQARGD